jgi:hypothetical protein
MPLSKPSKFSRAGPITALPPPKPLLTRFGGTTTTLDSDAVISNHSPPKIEPLKSKSTLPPIIVEASPMPGVMETPEETIKMFTPQPQSLRKFPESIVEDTSNFSPANSFREKASGSLMKSSRTPKRKLSAVSDDFNSEMLSPTTKSTLSC